MRCRKTCISRFIPRYLQPRRSGSGPNQTSLRGHFIMFPSIILQIKDTEPAIVWRTKALMTLLLPAIKRKKKKRHSVIRNQGVFLCAERAPEIRSNLPLCHAATPTESNFTDASTEHLTFSRCFYFGPLSICTSESGQMAGLLSDKNLRDTSTVTPRDSLAADARFSRGWNELITPHTTLGLPSSLSSPPVRRAA